MTSANAGRAQDRASRMDTASVVAWAEATSMNLCHTVSVGLRNGDPIAVHEALIQCEALYGTLMALAERQTAATQTPFR